MAERSKLTFWIGAVVAIIDVAGFVLARLQELDFLKNYAPFIYSTLISPPTFYILILVAIWLMFKGLYTSKQHPPRLSQRSAVTIAEATAQTIQGARDVYNITGPPALPRAQTPSAPQRNRPPRPQPDLIAVNLRQEHYRLPVAYDDDSVETKFCEGISLAIRNSSNERLSDADNVVAILEYRPQHGSPIHIDEGWWEDNADPSNLLTFYISPAQTRRLIIAVTSPNYDQTIAVGKVWFPDFHRHFPSQLKPLKPGEWTVHIQVRATGYQKDFTLTLVVAENAFPQCSIKPS